MTSLNIFLPQFQSALGTVVHATPLVEQLKSSVAGTRIIVASQGLAAEVWEGNPHLEQLLLTPNPLHHFAGAVRALRRAKLFGGESYTTLLTTGNERTRITLAAVLAGRSRRVGFAVHETLLQKPLQFDPALSQIENNLRLLAEPSLSVPVSVVEPKLYPDHGIAFAESMLAPLRHLRIVLATQTSVTQRKSWPAERWVELALALRKRYTADLIFIGTAAEAESIDALRAAIPFSTTSIAGATTIQQLAAVMQLCHLGIMLDTGPLHVARGVGLPAVIIAPAWSPVHEWLPVGNPRYRILKNADLPPPPPADYVIREVSVTEVLAAAESLLATAPPVDVAVGRTPES